MRHGWGRRCDRTMPRPRARCAGGWKAASTRIVQDEPRNWLEPAVRRRGQRAAGRAPGARRAAARRPRSVPELACDRRRRRRLPPRARARSFRWAAKQAEVMLIAEPPGREEAAAGRPIGGEAWQLAQRMLAAIGMMPRPGLSRQPLLFLFARRQAFARSSSPQCARRCPPSCRAGQRRSGCCCSATRPASALLGKPLIEARGHVHQVEGVRTVATFHPRFLLDRPSEKARAWSDLLLLMERPS